MFGRKVSLQIGPDGGAGKDFSGFRVRFRVEMNRKSTPNKATVEAYNLAPDSISLFQAPGAVVRVLAGYDAPMQIFRGSPVKAGVLVQREGPDRVLHVEAQDGGAEWSKRVNLSYATDTTSAQIVTDLAAALGVPVGLIESGTAFSLSQGVVLTGPASGALDRLCLSLGLRWYIRDGALVVASGSTGELAVCFSSVTGNLIGSPQRTKEGVEITGLLAPTLRPGKPFRVISEEVNGDFVCDSLVFQGDSGWDRDFYVVAKGVPV